VSSSASESQARFRAPWLFATAVALIALVVFSVTWTAEFVKWDDDINITRNTRIQSLNHENLSWMFTDVGLTRRYMPFGWLGFAMHHAVFGMSASSYHVVNTVLHSVSAALLFYVLASILRRAQGKEDARLFLCAALGALLWAIHPLRAEVVAWASGRLYLQATLFLLVSLLAYLGCANSESRVRVSVLYWISVTAFAASLLTYPIALAFPAALIALDYFPLRRFADGWFGKAARAAWAGKIPFLLVAAGQLAATFYARAHGAAVWQSSPSLADFSLLHRVMQGFYVWMWYCWKALVPIDLAPVYTRLVSFRPGETAFVVSLVGIVALTALLLWRRRRWPVALLLWVVYLLLLVPMLGLTEHPHYTSDRYSLLPHLVLAAGVAAGLYKLTKRSRSWFAAAGIIVAVCAVLSVRQAGVWRNSETLFRHMITTLGNDPYRADILWRLGEVLALQKRFPEATAAYEESIRVNPKDPNGYNGIGEALAEQGRWKEALPYFSRALDQQPGFLRSLNNIAWNLATAGDASVRNGAMALDLARALDERSGIRNAQFLETLAAAYAETGQFDRAVATAEKIPAMAKLSGEYEVAARNEKLIQLYRAGQPYRQQP
jgi:protein O-mannosyl-transferase